MADSVDLKGVVKHLVDGTFDRNLCVVCLQPLEDICENIFTRICKKDQEYSIAEVLEKMCQIQFADTDNFNVCSDCFLMASTAYKFYITCKRSDEILNYYIEELNNNIHLTADDSSSDSLCISLPEFTPSIENFDYDIEGCMIQEYFLSNDHDEIEVNKVPKIETKSEIEHKTKSPSKDDEDLVVVIDENGKSSFYKFLDGGLVSVSNKLKAAKRTPREMVVTQSGKLRKKRHPMAFTKCSQCPVKYRFLSKLQEHMKTEHDMDLYVCKICKTITEDIKEFTEHFASHAGTRNYDNIKKMHEEMDNIPDIDSAHICELCGHILPSEEELQDHYDKKHDKKYTCFYCGKMYKREISCEAHIKKHELHMKKAKRKRPDSPASESCSPQPSTNKKVSCCTVCGNQFVDERSLMWHSMLHTNERPYSCEVCGRGFITVNRRNQHMLCAHTMPSKRCPLCPALFHLRSMVNSHIKKVHLKTHKRRHRSSKHQHANIHWRTEQVPIQELGVDIQNEILELKTQQPHSDQQDWDSSNVQ